MSWLLEKCWDSGSFYSPDDYLGLKDSPNDLQAFMLKILAEIEYLFDAVHDQLTSSNPTILNRVINIPTEVRVLKSSPFRFDIYLKMTDEANHTGIVLPNCQLCFTTNIEIFESKLEIISESSPDDLNYLIILYSLLNHLIVEFALSHVRSNPGELPLNLLESIIAALNKKSSLPRGTRYWYELPEVTKSKCFTLTYKDPLSNQQYYCLAANNLRPFDSLKELKDLSKQHELSGSLRGCRAVVPVYPGINIEVLNGKELVAILVYQFEKESNSFVGICIPQVPGYESHEHATVLLALFASRANEFAAS